MPFPLTDIDLLCKVVDNYGDIGVVYRLARALRALENPPRLRLVVDDLASFARVAPGLDSSASFQVFRGWTVVRWSAPDGTGDERAIEEFHRKKPRVVIECFGCGRPDWLEAILFDPADPVPRLIVDLEYLSAEDFADDFHRLPSMTRSPLVRKVLFMPGFTAKTGGLILDGPFAGADGHAMGEEARQAARAAARTAIRKATAEELGLPTDADRRFWVFVFGYERDFARIVQDLALFNAGKSILVLAAAGKSQGCFREAWETAGKPFPVAFLPFLGQETWDAALSSADFSIVRGEDSFSRACLADRPFLWQAYPQDGRHQLVKVRAFLARLQPCLREEAFREIEALFIAFNERDRDEPATSGVESLFPVLHRYAESERGFALFSELLRKNGDLAANLMTYLTEIV